MTRRLVTRRGLLTFGIGIVAVTVAGAGASVLACRTSEQIAALSRLSIGLCRPPDMQVVGQVVRASFVDDRSLVAVTLDHPGLKDAASIECDGTRKAFLRDIFRNDFREGRVHVVNRWVLSEAECLIAATASIVHAVAPEMSSLEFAADEQAVGTSTNQYTPDRHL